jgi:hypothetical protein
VQRASRRRAGERRAVRALLSTPHVTGHPALPSAPRVARPAGQKEHRTSQTLTSTHDRPRGPVLLRLSPRSRRRRIGIGHAGPHSHALCALRDVGVPVGEGGKRARAVPGPTGLPERGWWAYASEPDGCVCRPAVAASARALFRVLETAVRIPTRATPCPGSFRASTGSTRSARCGERGGLAGAPARCGP